MCFVLDPVSVHDPKTKHTKHLKQVDGNPGTHVDGDSRELEDGDLLVLVAGDEAEELMPVLKEDLIIEQFISLMRY